MITFRFYTFVCVATFTLLMLPSQVRGQDTTLVTFRKFPLPILSMVADDEGVIWFNTDKDLYRFEEEGFQWEKSIDREQVLVLRAGKLDLVPRGSDLSPPYRGDAGWASKLPSTGDAYFSATDKKGITWVTHGTNFYGFKIAPFSGPSDADRQQGSSTYLMPGLILLLAVVVIFFYVQWKKTQRRIDTLRHKQRLP